MRFVASNHKATAMRGILKSKYSNNNNVTYIVGLDRWSRVKIDHLLMFNGKSNDYNNGHTLRAQ